MLSSAPSNRAPSPDGLPYEFYTEFFPELGHHLAAVLTRALCEGQIPRSFTKSAVVLLHKKDRPKEEISNWRPIALANTDSKTLFRILIARLSLDMSSIIHPDQVRFIPGRNIVNTALNVKILLLEGELGPQSSEAALIMLD